MLLHDEDNYGIRYLAKITSLEAVEIHTRDGLQGRTAQATQGGCAGSIIAGFQNSAEQRP